MFFNLLNMSVTACWLILAVILFRLVIKKSPKWINCLLWGLVGLRLVLPFSIESIFSLIPSADIVPEKYFYYEGAALENTVSFDVVSNPNPAFDGNVVYETSTSVDRLQLFDMKATLVWFIGVCILAIYAFVSCLRIYLKIREKARLSGNIYICDNIDTPFIFGITKPKICLPSSMAEEDREFVIYHEKAHLKRKDFLWKPLGFIMLTVYWFNPLIWVAYILFCRDIEAACDEKVIKERGNVIKKEYSLALINCSVSRKLVTACPLAFGEVGVKGRVKSILNYKRPTFWVIAISIVICFIVSLFFFTSPEKQVSDDLKSFVDSEIIATQKNNYDNNNYSCVSWDAIDIKNDGNNTTLYIRFTYQEYSQKDGEISLETATHCPAVIEVKDSGNKYELVSYREAEDGSEYVNSIQDMFPMYLWSKVFDEQEYLEKQDAKCYISAMQYFNNGLHEEFSNIDDYRDVIPLIEENSTVLAVHYPDSKDDSARILMGEANGSDLIDYLYKKTWKKCNEPISDLISPGSVEFLIADGCRLTIHHKQKDNFFSYAVMTIGENTVYYRASYDDYKNAVDILKAPQALQEEPTTDSITITPTGEEIKVNSNPYFNATVLKIYEKSVLVKPFEDEDEFNSADKITIGKKTVSTKEFPELSVGDEIRIVYNGEIQETYPAHLPTVFAVYLLDEIE